MAFELPTLDDRSFQDIVDEAKSRINHYCEEWTDHNVSDPGVTIIELFAWMMEMLLYRMNQMPKHHYVQFMQMLGIQLEDPVPSKTKVTFWLSKAQPSTRLADEQIDPLVIPEGTATATTQTETEPSIVFTTDRDSVIQAPHLVRVERRITRSDGKNLGFSSIDLAELEKGNQTHFMFARNSNVTPLVNSAFYLGFENDLSHHVLRIVLQIEEASGEGVNPDLDPPYIWEAATGGSGRDRWLPCLVDEDSTRVLNADGFVQIHLPRMGKYRVGEHNLFWVRVRLRKLNREDQEVGISAYSVSPQIRCITSEDTLGVAIPSTQAHLVQNEYLGRSDGSPGQRYVLRSSPVLSRESRETLMVEGEGKPPVPWTEVNSFSESESDSTHFMLDSSTGEVRLGPAVRQRDGTMKLYGTVPERGALLTFLRYRCGGGHRGNVRVRAVNTLKSSIPYISRVENLEAASGGLDAETLDEAMMKASAIIRARERAVTEEDFEYIAKNVLHQKIHRVKCIQPIPEHAKGIADNLVYILVMARVNFPQGPLTRQQLTLDETDKQELIARLEERRLLTMRLDVRPPAFYWAAVRVQLKAAFDANKTEIEQEVLRRLYRFVNPIIGGDADKGWEFGRNLYVSDIYPHLQGIPGVLYIRAIHLFETDENNSINRDESLEEIDVTVRHGVIMSGEHWVIFDDEE